LDVLAFALHVLTTSGDMNLRAEGLLLREMSEVRRSALMIDELVDKPAREAAATLNLMCTKFTGKDEGGIFLNLDVVRGVLRHGALLNMLAGKFARTIYKEPFKYNLHGDVGGLRGGEPVLVSLHLLLQSLAVQGPLHSSIIKDVMVLGIATTLVIADVGRGDPRLLFRWSHQTEEPYTKIVKIKDSVQFLLGKNPGLAYLRGCGPIYVTLLATHTSECMAVFQQAGPTATKDFGADSVCIFIFITRGLYTTRSHNNNNNNYSPGSAPGPTSSRPCSGSRWCRSYRAALKSPLGWPCAIRRCVLIYIIFVYLPTPVQLILYILFLYYRPRWRASGSASWSSRCATTLRAATTRAGSARRSSSCRS
jgi:hypothetical protein